MTKTQAQSVALTERVADSGIFMTEADRIVLRHDLFELDADAECTTIPEILNLGLALDYQCRRFNRFGMCGHRIPIDPKRPNEAWADMWFHMAGHGGGFRSAEAWMDSPQMVRITEHVPAQPLS